MSGFFGCVSKSDCVYDLFYGTDYNSHLGTRKGGMAVLNSSGFNRSIHSLESDYFRSKFEPELSKFRGNSGIGIISDLEASPIIANSHLGRFAVAMVGRINNIESLVDRALNKKQHFAELSQGGVNPTELISVLICEGKSFKDGIRNVQERVKGSCSLLILSNEGIYAARDKYGRTPVVIGKKKDSYAMATETTSFSNLGYMTDYFMGPGEILKVTPDGYEQIKPPESLMQICAFLWVYYGFPSSSYEGINVDACRYNCGKALAANDDTEADYVSGIPGFRNGTCSWICYGKKYTFCKTFCKIYPHLVKEFYASEPGCKRLCCKDETYSKY